ncbi:MAG: hypothetical protein ACTSV5_10460 [Promethearchaeota archaeon]
MFNLDDFEKFEPLYPIIERLNKNLAKNKLEKVSNLIGQLQILLDEEKYTVPITYILSILVEKESILLSEDLIKKVFGYLDDNNIKLKLNSIIILGFVSMENSSIINKFLKRLVNFLLDDDKDIRDNAHYFLNEIVKKKGISICDEKSTILKALSIEKNVDNLISLVNFLTKCEEFSFNYLFEVRHLLKQLFTEHFENSLFYSELVTLCKYVFPITKELKFEELNLDQILDILDKLFLMLKKTFSEEKENEFKETIRAVKNSKHKDMELYFYIKNRGDKRIYFYELEESKLSSLFDKRRVSNEELLQIFAHIIKDEQELTSMVNKLLELNHIKGYYSELGFFYPFSFLKSEFTDLLQDKGMINTKRYDYLPPSLIQKLIREISKSSKTQLLKGKSNSAFYSLKKIKNKINSEAAKNSSIDLKAYKERLVEEDFKTLIKNIPKDYLTNFHRGTHWLTNLGLLKIKKEIENSKILGYFSITKVSEKIGIIKILLSDIFQQNIDVRSGVFDKNGDVFYYSKFIKDRISILITDPVEKEKNINILAKELNIDRAHILTSIDENIRLIGNEIKKLDMIKLSDYVEKTGMSISDFLNFIEKLGLKYFKKGDFLIINEAKIDDAKEEIKLMLIEKSKSAEIITLGNLDITSSIVKDLLGVLQESNKIKGIFYEEDGQLQFFTQLGIENLMEESSLFSFEDFFPDKELSKEEIDLLTSIVKDLLNKRRIKGKFDEKSLIFSSDDIIFAQNYNAVFHEFEKIIKNYCLHFQNEFIQIKNILTKQDETIIPQEIKIIQEIIKRINGKYIRWRHRLDAFIRRTNSELLRKQGYSIKKYKSMLSSMKYKDIKFFEDDVDVKSLMHDFNSWIKLFNELELKYGNIIFYQKRLILNSEHKENREKLNTLLEQLKLI